MTLEGESTATAPNTRVIEASSRNVYVVRSPWTTAARLGVVMVSNISTNSRMPVTFGPSPAAQRLRRTR